MRDKGPVSMLVELAVWLTGVLVSLAVGFGMVDSTLTISWLTQVNAGIVTVVAGWIVIVLTVVSVVLAIIDRL